MMELPRGTVTFLFTDIESSTRLWQRATSAMNDAIARHDLIVRGAVTAHGGAVYKVVGDALQVAFPTAPDAVLAAIDAQRMLAAEDWTANGLPEPLLVRMAVHTGAVDPDPDGDYRSPVLNRAGRLLAAGHGGQVLLSAAAAELVRGILPEEVGLRNLGEHRLKDLMPERLYQVTAPNLPELFAPLATPDLRPNNLPTPPTPLVGRVSELAEVVALLRRADVRLVTLTGPGGMGKTRLSLAVAAELMDDVSDGAFFVSLAAITDQALVASAIARELDLQEEAGRLLAATLTAHLRDKELLLVLDNFEQVTPAAALVGELLAACPRLKVLVTSRTPLRLRAEREFPVPPLALPDAHQVLPPEQLRHYDAVRLFVERAVAIRPDFAVTNTNAPAVAEICHRLDGLPLAIELAAARVRLFPPEALLARLEKRLRLLTGGARDLPRRQQTLRDAIAWSHDLLSPHEQILFRRLAVFAGGCTFDAAEAVSDPDGELAVGVIDGVASLAEQSLVRLAHTQTGEPRIMMLETIREFALEQLDRSEEAEAIRHAHAAYFHDWAGEAASLSWGPEQAQWLDQMETEIDNVRAALGWAIDRAATATALELCISLEKLWDARGFLREGRSWLEQGLALPMDGVRPGTWAQSHSNAGSLAQAQGDLDGAQALQERALAIVREVDTEGGRRGTAHVLNRLGIIEFLRGNHDRADALQTDALARFRDLNDKGAMATALNNLGVTADDRGDFGRARQLYEEALALQREEGDTQSIAIYLGNLGEVARDQADPVGSAIYYHEALGLWRALKDRWNTAAALDGVAILAVVTGQAERATRLFGAADALREAVGVPLPENEYADHDRYLATARRALGDEAFARAWVAGQHLLLEEAIDEALAQTDDTLIGRDHDEA